MTTSAQKVVPSTRTRVPASCALPVARALEQTRREPACLVLGGVEQLEVAAEHLRCFVAFQASCALISAQDVPIDIESEDRILLELLNQSRRDVGVSHWSHRDPQIFWHTRTLLEHETRDVEFDIIGGSPRSALCSPLTPVACCGLRPYGRRCPSNSASVDRRLDPRLTQRDRTHAGMQPRDARTPFLWHACSSHIEVGLSTDATGHR